jgi:hypothetical protein
MLHLTKKQFKIKNMTNENELLKKLMVSKQIMDRHKEIPRNHSEGQTLSAPMVDSFAPVQASYNIPQELMQENVAAKIPQYTNSQDRIMSSKVPDAIKQLMIEHPIAQPNAMTGPTLSDELVEKAARLMGTGGKQVQESIPQRQTQSQSISDNKNLKELLKEVVREVLAENGMITESTSKTNDTFSFKVGKHIFEGKVTKVKKIQ